MKNVIFAKIINVFKINIVSDKEIKETAKEASNDSIMGRKKDLYDSFLPKRIQLQTNKSPNIPKVVLPTATTWGHLVTR